MRKMSLFKVCVLALLISILHVFCGCAINNARLDIKQNMYIDVLTIGIEAQRWFKTPRLMGGGGTIKDFDISEQLTEK